MKKKYYLLFAIIAYFCFIISTLPAKLVLNQLTPPANIRISGISGTIWRGKATAIRLDAANKLTDIQWNFALWRLFAAQLSIHIQGKFQQLPFRAQLYATPTGKISAQDVSATIAASSLATLFALPLAKLDGVIQLDLDHISWHPETLPLASGVIHWKNAAVTVAETARLGNITITLRQKNNDRILAGISNQGGELKLHGDASAATDASYGVSLEMTPTASASQSIISSLAMFAKKQNNGSFLLKSSGKIPLPGIKY